MMEPHLEQIARIGLSRRAFCTTTALGMVASASLLRQPPAAFAETLPAQDEYAVLATLGRVMDGVWPRGAYPNAQGATEANTSGFIQIGFQYHTFTLLPAAVELKNTRYLDALLRIAEYAFAHQHSDGRFDYSESNGTITTGSTQGPLGEASTATMFFYDFGHTLVLLPKNDWFRTAPECEPFRKRLDVLREKCRPSLDWLLRQRALLTTDSAAANRTLAHALSYYFLGRALERSDAMDAGRQIARRVLDAQTPDGVFIESAGFDSSYQAVNVLECEWMYLNLDPADSALREQLWNAIRRGVARELPSVLPTGEVSTAGNSRISANGESFEGHKKTVNSKQVLAALGYYGVMAPDASVMAKMRRIFAFYYPNDPVDF